MIAIVDYGIGNLGSVTKAFRLYAAEVVLSGDPRVLRSARALVLPGDGAFAAAMHEIRRRGLEPVLLEAAAAGVPLLGICIGMQLFFEHSEEHGHHTGLGLLPGRVRPLFAAGEHPELSVPHMGWNRLWQRRPHALFDGLDDGTHVYFVHSYRCEPPPELVLATTDHGRELPAVVGRDNVLGMQFHPEKSQRSGLRLVENFVAGVLAGGARPSLAAHGRAS